MTNLQADKIGDMNKPPHDHPPSAAHHFSEMELLTIFESGTNTDPLPELLRIFSALLPAADQNFLIRLHNDISSVFEGKIRGFRQNTVKYHNLRHTRSVVLATIRLLHGLKCDGHQLSEDEIKLGILCAYFHDTGMLLTIRDSASCGSAYLKNHEERSIRFARDYISDHGLPASYADNCETIINCTNLNLKPQFLAFTSEDMELIGHVLGTADILAQMGDRYYLECLPLLFLEQQDAGIANFTSSMDLMRETAAFYYEVIEKRLLTHFQNRCVAMQSHFREWWGIDRNLYLEFIEKNIQYLKKIFPSSGQNPALLDEYLRRQQPKIRR